MRVAITGKSGQVSTAIHEYGLVAGHEVILVGRPELDLTDPASVTAALAVANADVVVSAAAYTAVDQAESEPEQAYAINATGAGAVASAAHDLGVPVIHLSTDYVFDGELARPYREDDPTGPSGIYGASKLAGERAVLEACDDATILRLAWVYSPFGANFVKTMLRLGAAGSQIPVVSDQFGNPTSALDIASGVLQVAENLVTRKDPALRGIFHLTAAGEASWAQFAAAIFEASHKWGGPLARVLPIATADYQTPARRPANSRLDCELIKQVHEVALPHWQKGLEVVIARLIKE